jgi:hypothetical protein
MSPVVGQFNKVFVKFEDLENVLQTRAHYIKALTLKLIDWAGRESSEIGTFMKEVKLEAALLQFVEVLNNKMDHITAQDTLVRVEGSYIKYWKGLFALAAGAGENTMPSEQNFKVERGRLSMESGKKTIVSLREEPARRKLRN